MRDEELEILKEFNPYVLQDGMKILCREYPDVQYSDLEEDDTVLLQNAIPLTAPSILLKHMAESRFDWKDFEDLDQLSFLQRKKLSGKFKNLRIVPEEKLSNLTDTVSNALRQVYKNRRLVGTQENVDVCLDQQEYSVNLFGENVEEQSRNTGFIVRGISGTGKSTLVRMMAEYFPKGIKILHPEDDEDMLVSVMVPFLWVETPADEQNGQFFVIMAQQLDKILGVSMFEEEMKRCKEKDQVNYCMRLIERFNVGMILINDFDRIVSKSNYRFLNQLRMISAKTGVCYGFTSEPDIGKIKTMYKNQINNMEYRWIEDILQPVYTMDDAIDTTDSFKDAVNILMKANYTGIPFLQTNAVLKTLADYSGVSLGKLVDLLNRVQNSVVDQRMNAKFSGKKDIKEIDEKVIQTILKKEGCSVMQSTLSNNFQLLVEKDKQEIIVKQAADEVVKQLKSANKSVPDLELIQQLCGIIYDEYNLHEMLAPSEPEVIQQILKQLIQILEQNNDGIV